MLTLMFGKKTKMKKKRIIRTSLFIGAVAILIWATPVGVGLIRAKPLSGSFMISSCACGHEVFYLIENSQAYEYCPGHKQKKLIGPARRDGDLVRVASTTDSAPEFEIKLENGSHFMKFPWLKNDEWEVVEQVSNPSRNSLCGYFPE